MPAPALNPFDAFRLTSAAATATTPSKVPRRLTSAAATAATPSKRRKIAPAAARKECATNAAAADEAPRQPAGLPEMLPAHPLRLVIVGHNPSERAWMDGHYYANPSNHMWKILEETNLAPKNLISGAQDDYKMPALCGVGFTDVGTGVPGTQSSKFSDADLRRWTLDAESGFYARLRRHVSLAGGTPPRVLAFAGKRQYTVLFSKKNQVDVGPQSHASLPPDWPLDESTSVWVMPSTSGASALTREQRYGPWHELASHVLAIDWEQRAL